MWNSKDVYYLSDSTGILAMNLGQSLLCQFPGVHFHEEHFPFICSVADATRTLDYILKNSGGRRPLLFSTIMNTELIAILNHPEVEFFDAYAFYLTKLEQLLEVEALRVPGYSRQMSNDTMSKRVAAIHFSLEHDDGIKLDELDEAEVILLGVSRAGKTPVSIYLATQLGLKAANFPLTEEYLARYRLPPGVSRNLQRVVGLTTSPEILHKMRQERYPNSNYAKATTCFEELDQAQRLFFKHRIPTINTAGKSIEEIATQVCQEIGLSKKTDQV